MHKTGRYARRVSLQRLPLAVKGLVLIFALCVFVRLISALGADTAAKNTVCGLFSNDRVSCAILNFEIGASVKAGQSVLLTSMILDPSLYGGTAPEAEAEAAPDGGATPAAASQSGAAEPSSSGDDTDTWPYFNTWDTAPSPASPAPNIITEPAKPTSTDTIAVNNRTDYVVDTAALLKEPLQITLAEDKPVVLIIHTHASEAYAPDGKDQYVASDYYRTQDKTQSVIRVGDAMTETFEKAGISVIHDTGVYDYPSYQDSYNNSYAAIQSNLKKYPSIKVVIDVHRDHIEADDGSVYRTIAQVDDTTCSQVKFVMGTDYNGLKHPNWKENFKLALHIQQEMNTLYPSLAKPVEISPFRYNQQATPGSMLVEIGCTGNTLQESLAAAGYFAGAASEVLLALYE